MLKKFSCSNFHSFAEEVEVNFEVNKRNSETHYVRELSNGEHVNNVVAVVGPNGSGKTQLIKPIGFLQYFLIGSYRNAGEGLLPFSAHALHADKESTFKINFIAKGVEYKYELQLTPDRISKEALYEKTSNSFSYVFMRELVKDGEIPEYTYKHKKHFSFAKKIASKISKKASIISAAASHDVQYAQAFIQFAHYIQTNVHMFGRSNYQDDNLYSTSEFYSNNPEMKNLMEELLCSFDLGLNSVEIKKLKIPRETGGESIEHIPYGIHKTSKGDYRLHFLEESSGTRSAFVLSQHLSSILKHGGIAVIDEIDNDLHPHLLPVIIDYFKSPTRNPKNAQLFFTCHTPEILNILNKFQVYMVEKNDGESEAWRLDEVAGLRADDNAYAKYMTGALGATPEV